MNRRRFLKVALGSASSSLLLAACGTNANSSVPAPTTGAAPAVVTGGQPLKIGFIPLTDCASVVMADKLGYYKAAGLNVEVTKEASWANIRDKLLTGELSAAHALFGMPFSVFTGVGGTAGKQLKIAMILNTNGQGITLEKGLASSVPYGDLAALKRAVAAMPNPTFAMTFPGGTHDLWLRYTLGAAGIDQNKVKISTIPPPQMVANMKVGNMNGYSVGEPWNGMGVKEDIGYTFLATQDIWKDHPEKALVANAEFAASQRAELKQVMGAILQASQWLDQPENRVEAAQVLSDKAYVNAAPEVITARLQGKYDLGAGLGEKIFSDDYMLFYKNGQVNFPRQSHAIWFMSQYVRFGYLTTAPDYSAVAETLIMQDLYDEVAKDLKIEVPDDDRKPFTLKLDNIEFDPNNVPDSLNKWQA
jgi:nitrate/nitrite transport system substrate-binding protein